MIFGKHHNWEVRVAMTTSRGDIDGPHSTLVINIAIYAFTHRHVHRTASLSLPAQKVVACNTRCGCDTTSCLWHPILS